MLVIKNIREAERFVARQQKLGNNVRWDGWDIVFFRAAPQAVYSREGVWNREHSTYGFDNRVRVNEKGEYHIDYRNVRRAARPTRP